MKRLFTIGLMLASAFALTNCAEQLDTPIQENDIVIDVAEQEFETGTPYEVYIDDVETKTHYSNNKTIWVAGLDAIALYSKPSASTGTPTYSRHEKFTYVAPTEQGAKKRFEGFLNGGLSTKNDWYFIYPFGEGSSTGSTINETIPFGSATQNQQVTKENESDKTKLHLAGSGCPLYGTDLGVKKNDRPQFKMNYLYSVVALNIVNETGGDIAVSYVEFLANEDIVGNFKVDITGETPTYVAAGNNSMNTRVQLSEAVKIGNTESYKLYIAIKPFDASGDNITISINGPAVGGSDNGVSKTFNLESLKFDAGKITTFNVPIVSINEQNFGPITSNILDVKGHGVKSTVNSAGETEYTSDNNINYVQFSHPTPHPVKINGKSTNAYILGKAKEGQGTNEELGIVKITGTPAELIKYAPMGFFVSSWSGEKVVMRVESITCMLANLAPITFKWEDLKGVIKDTSKIQFKGVLPLEQVKIETNEGNQSETHMLIMHEEPFHKNISESKINELLASFDDNKDDDDGKVKYKPTLEGLRQALANPYSLPKGLFGYVDKLTKYTDADDITAYIIWQKLTSKLESHNLLKYASKFLFGSPQMLFAAVANQPIEVVLSTRPAGKDEATDPRIVVWGLNSEAITSTSTQQ